MNVSSSRSSVVHRIKPSLIVTVLASLVLWGCSSGPSKYLKSSSIPPLKVEDEQQKERLSQIYVVPPLENDQYQFEETFTAPRPLPLSSALLADKVKIQKLGNQRWVFITQSPSEVWPQVRAFLGENGLAVGRVDPAAGILETQWLQFKEDTSQSDRYRIIIEQGVQPDSSEIKVLHMSLPKQEVLAGAEGWPDFSSSEEREAWMIDELSAILASTINEPPSSLLAQTIGGRSKVTMDVTEDGEPALRLNMPKSRALASVSHALKSDGFFTWDRINEPSVFYTNYVNLESPENRSGWFTKTLSFMSLGLYQHPEKRAKAKTETPYSIQQVLGQVEVPDSAPNWLAAASKENQGESTSDKPAGFLVGFESKSTEEYLLMIRNAQGGRLSDRQAAELLTYLRNNLI